MKSVELSWSLSHFSSVRGVPHFFMNTQLGLIAIFLQWVMANKSYKSQHLLAQWYQHHENLIKGPNHTQQLLAESQLQPYSPSFCSEWIATILFPSRTQGRGHWKEVHNEFLFILHSPSVHKKSTNWHISSQKNESSATFYFSSKTQQKKCNPSIL